MNHLLIEFNNVNSQNIEAKKEIEKLEKNLTMKEDMLEIINRELLNRNFKFNTHSETDFSIDIDKVNKCKCELHM